MKNIGLIFFFLFSCVLLLAQSTFQRTFHVQEEEISFNYITSLNDTIIGTGYFSENISKYDNIITAINENGNTLWSYIYNVDVLSLNVRYILTSRDNNIVLLAELRDGMQRPNSSSQHVVSFLQRVK